LVASAPAMAPNSDAVPVPLGTLVRQASEGDRAAEATLCGRFQGTIRAFAWRREPTQDAVNEFTQEVLLRLIEALRTGAVRDPDALGGYVLGICRTLVAGAARQRQRRAELLALYGADLSPLELPAEGPSLYPVAKLEDCVSQLTPRAQSVVRLGYVLMKTHAEVAEELGVSPASARVLRHRTLQTLRECMAGSISWESA
jgi:RNA polymerase sigma factor (sigma-70 family)